MFASGAPSLFLTVRYVHTPLAERTNMPRLPNQRGRADAGHDFIGGMTGMMQLLRKAFYVSTPYHAQKSYLP